MITNIVRVLGIIFVVLFSTVSILFSWAEREFDDPYVSKILSYPSFFEDRFYDFRMKQTLEEKPWDERIVLAEIDDPTIQIIGRWPFSRSYWAEFINRMDYWGAKVVAFDVFFSEPEKACGADNPDEAFAQSIARFQSEGNRKVIIPYSMNIYGINTFREFKEIPDDLYNYILNTQQNAGLNLKPMTVSKDVWPIPKLFESEPMLGHIEAEADADGIYRHYQVLSNVDELYFPGFALAAYMSFTGDNARMDYLVDGDPKIVTEKGEMSINYRGESKVRWLGGRDAYPRIPVHKIINAEIDDPEMKKVFNGRLVMVGSTAYGAHDLRHTPVDDSMPGIFFHMNMAHMLMEGHFFKSKADSTMFSWLILLGGTLIMVIIQLMGRPILDLVTVVALVGGLYLIDTYHLTPSGYEIKLFFCLFSIGACYSWNTFLNFYLSNKDKAFLKSALGNYISPELIEEMYESGEPPKLGGTEGIITAYFTDIQGFSTFSEKLTAPQLVELLNEYLTDMTDILLEERGTLDKYEGDAIIAFFGAPMKLEDHAIRACRVASRMQERLGVLREKWRAEGDKWPEIVHNMRMRIGINSGSIVTGNMGSTQRMNYTMMGDSVNLAARLEEAAKQYGIFTQVSEFTKELTGDYFIFRELDTIRVVGKSEPVTVYDLLGVSGDTEQHLLDLQKEFHQGLAFYKEQKWDEAIDQFNKSLVFENKRFPDLEGKKTNPSLIYIEKCEEFKINPPPADWDGVYTLTSK